MTAPQLAREPGRWAVALAGAVALAVAMGLGRFAFTPILPMMLHDGVIDLHAASWLASANYIGYLVGALLCTFHPWIAQRAPRLPPANGVWLLRAGLVATGLLTLGMALPAAVLWPALRFAAGVASAFVFVYTSGWCLAQLARRNASALGGVMFTGPGAGIVASGLAASAMVQAGWHAATAWAIFGVLAAVLTVAVWRIFGATLAVAPAAAAPAAIPAPAASVSASSIAGAVAGAAGAASAAPAASAVSHGRPEIACLTLAYGTAGFGYIVTATFLPVIAREAIPGSPWLDMFWPIFGLGVIAGALISTRLKVHGDLRRLLAGCHVIQASGIVIGIASPNLLGFALGSLLLGLPFTALTFFAMQEVRRLKPLLAPSYMGLLTAMYGIGQIVGPPLVALLLKRSSSASAGFTLALEIAASVLLVGAALYLAMTRAFPVIRR